MRSHHVLVVTAFIIILFAVGLASAGAQESPTRFWLSPDVEEVKTGETVTIAINVSEAQGVYGTSFKLSYDPEAFEVVPAGNKPVAPGEFFANEPGFALRNTHDPQTGVIEYALTLMQPAQPVSGDGLLGTLTLKALIDTAVSVTVREATFVAPEFKEVDGRIVAERVNQVAVQIEDTAPADVNSPATSSVAVEPATAPASAAQPAESEVDPAVIAMFSNPALDESTATQQHDHEAVVVEARRTDDVVLVFAGFFFILGLVMLTLSVGMYSRMRFLIASPNELSSQQV
jgi:hypothetical protein